MRDISIKITDGAVYAPSIAIGRRGENQATRLLIDVTAWQGVAGEDALYTLILRRADGVAWPVLVAATPEIGIITYILAAADTAVAGATQLELQALRGDTIVKSASWRMHVADTLAAGDPPAAFEADWLEEISANAAAAAAAQVAAEAAQAGAQANADATATDRQTVAQDKAATAEHKADAEAAATEAGAQAEEAERQAGIAANNILNGVSVHNESPASHEDIREDNRRIEAIARGRSTSYTFDTMEQLDAWLAGAYVRADGKVKADLIQGDNLWIRDTGVKDQWWDAEQDTRQELEAEAPDLTDYYLKTQVDALLPIAISRSEYAALASPEAGRIYNVYED